MDTTVSPELKQLLEKLLYAAERAVFNVRVDSFCWHNQMDNKAKDAIAELDRAVHAVIGYKPDSPDIPKSPQPAFMNR